MTLYGFLLEVLVGIYLLPIRIFTILIHGITHRPLGLRKVQNASGKGPVLLIHGLNMDEVCMWNLRWRLKKDGWGPLYILHLGPLSWTIQKSANLLEEAIAEITPRFGKVHIIGHSMGGLVARYFLQKLNGASKTASLVTLATPHMGTPLAHLAWSVSGRQLIPQSPFLRELNDPKDPLPTGVPYLFLWSNLDILVPAKWGRAWSPHLNGFGAPFCMIPFLGHMMILHSNKAYLKINDFLMKNHSQVENKEPSMIQG